MTMPGGPCCCTRDCGVWPPCEDAWDVNRGEWATATDYAVGDLAWATVSGNRAYYICSSAHTSGASTQPESGGSWATVWDAGDRQPGCLWLETEGLEFKDCFEIYDPDGEDSSVRASWCHLMNGICDNDLGDFSYFYFPDRMSLLSFYNRYTNGGDEPRPCRSWGNRFSPDYSVAVLSVCNCTDEDSDGAIDTSLPSWWPNFGASGLLYVESYALVEFEDDDTVRVRIIGTPRTGAPAVEPDDVQPTLPMLLLFDGVADVPSGWVQADGTVSGSITIDNNQAVAMIGTTLATEDGYPTLKVGAGGGSVTITSTDPGGSPPYDNAMSRAGILSSPDESTCSGYEPPQPPDPPEPDPPTDPPTPPTPPVPPPWPPIPPIPPTQTCTLTPCDDAPESCVGGTVTRDLLCAALNITPCDPDGEVVVDALGCCYTVGGCGDGKGGTMSVAGLSLATGCDDGVCTLTCYKLTSCQNGEIVYTTSDLSDIVDGSGVGLWSGDCWTVTEVDPGDCDGDTEEVTGMTEQDDCDDTDCPKPCTNCNGTQPAASLSGSASSCNGNDMTPMSSVAYTGFTAGATCIWSWSGNSGTKSAGITVSYTTATDTWDASVDFGDTNNPPGNVDTINLVSGGSVSGLKCNKDTGELEGSFTLTTVFSGSCSTGSATVTLG